MECLPISAGLREEHMGSMLWLNALRCPDRHIHLHRSGWAWAQQTPTSSTPQTSCWQAWYCATSGRCCSRHCAGAAPPMPRLKSLYYNSQHQALCPQARVQAGGSTSMPYANKTTKEGSWAGQELGGRGKNAFIHTHGRVGTDMCGHMGRGQKGKGSSDGVPRASSMYCRWARPRRARRRTKFQGMPPGRKGPWGCRSSKRATPRMLGYAGRLGRGTTRQRVE